VDGVNRVERADKQKIVRKQKQRVTDYSYYLEQKDARESKKRKSSPRGNDFHYHPSKEIRHDSRERERDAGRDRDEDRRKDGDNRDEDQDSRHKRDRPSSSFPTHVPDRDRERERERERDRERERERERERDRERERERERDRDRDRDRERGDRFRDREKVASSHERTFWPAASPRGDVYRPHDTTYPSAVYPPNRGGMGFGFRGKSPPTFGRGPTTFPSPAVFPPRNRFDLQPSSTLFVANIPKDVTSRELNILFRFMPGFQGVRLVMKEGRAPICFADFMDPNCAALAMQSLQGYRMDKDYPGLTVEFDRGPKDR